MLSTEFLDLVYDYGDRGSIALDSLRSYVNSSDLPQAEEQIRLAWVAASKGFDQNLSDCECDYLALSQFYGCLCQ